MKVSGEMSNIYNGDLSSKVKTEEEKSEKFVFDNINSQTEGELEYEARRGRYGDYPPPPPPKNDKRRVPDNPPPPPPNDDKHKNPRKKGEIVIRIGGIEFIIKGKNGQVDTVADNKTSN